MTASIEIQIPGADTVKRALSTQGSVTVGRTTDKGVAVPTARQFEREHFMVEARSRGCQVMILPGARSQAVFKGAPFSDGMVGWGELLLIGDVQVRFLKGGVAGGSPVVFGGLVVTAGLLVHMVLQEGREAGLGRGMPAAPELNLAAAECGETGVAAKARGEELEEQGLASGERYAFDLTDGMDAARLFRAASACYTQAGDQLAAQRAEQSHGAWRARLTERYTAHRLRLRVALDRSQVGVAQKQVRILSRFLKDFDGHPYQQWLASVESELQYASAEK